MKEDLVEKLAELCHNQWSGWMEYLFSKCDFTLPHILDAIKDGSALIPDWATERWKRQMNTEYKDLSEEEKESDRKEARGFINLLKEEGVL